MPAIGLSTTDHISAAYPQDEPFEEERVKKWLNEIMLRKTLEEEKSTDFSKKIADPTLVDFYLPNTIRATRDTFHT